MQKQIEPLKPDELAAAQRVIDDAKKARGIPNQGDQDQGRKFQPFIPLSMEDQLKAANTSFDEQAKANPTDHTYKEPYRHVYVLAWLKTEYRKLYVYTMTVMEELQD